MFIHYAEKKCIYTVSNVVGLCAHKPKRFKIGLAQSVPK